MFQGFFVYPACDIFDYLCQKHKKSIPQKQIMVIFTCCSPVKCSWLSLRSLCGLFLVIRSKIVFKARLVVWAYNYIPLTVKTSQKRFCEVLQPTFKISFLLTQQFCKKLCSKYTCRKTPSFSTMFLCNMKKMQVVHRSLFGVRFTGSSRL